MEAKQFTTTILTAGEGYFLTQVADVDINERIVASVLALGKNDSPENYREITAEEADAYNEAKLNSDE